MAGLKKSKRSKDTGSPNLVLVLFLITFVISSIILGLLWYFSVDEKNRALADADRSRKEKTAAQNAVEMYQTIADDLRNALGSKLDGDDLAKLKAGREKLSGGAFSKLGEKNLETYTKLIDTLDKDLNFDPASGQYTTTYDTKYRDEAEKAEKFLAALKKAQADLVALQGQFKEISDQQDALAKKVTDRLDKENKVVLTAANKQTEQMTKQIQENASLNQSIAEQSQAFRKLEDNYKRRIRTLEDALAEKDKERADSGVTRTDTREPHALLLDISVGKPLWDDPVGAITRVDAKNKEVTINLGSAKGVRPDLTFSVFAPSKYIATRAERQMKGMIEVIRVLGPNASLARITATFDPEFPMHEGDLLFNLFWGTHVAVTGYPNITGIPSESPSEQQRQLNDFLYLLSRQGMIVDAYLDLTDGQIKGAMTANTRYLIRGEDLRIDPKELENKEPRAERALAVNNGALAMRKDAIDKGIFVVSARNFATMIGYRTANAKEQVGFRPQLPTAGSVLPGVGGGVGAVGAVRAAPMPMAEPKEKDDAKDKDKN